ncbi:MAG: tRNA (adenosine(37)-N6)-threonylcarbamoyltransferase complex transferase subunit TsaD, partial [Patescibacteria group bacterium]
GVAANQTLVRNLECTMYNVQLKAKLHVPPPELCTDNAAMIATCALFNFHPVDPLTLQSDPNLSLNNL